jgi:hypothetical protein
MAPKIISPLKKKNKLFTFRSINKMPQGFDKVQFPSFVKNALLLVLSIFLLSGCVTLSDPETSQVYHNDVVGTIDDAHTLEQTIQTRQSRIDGMFLWLQSNPVSQTQTGKIVFSLNNPPDSSSPWASTSIRCSAYRPDQPLYITFVPKEITQSNTYQLIVKAEGCNVQIFGRAEDAYASGAAYQNSIPLPGDIAFRVKYRYDMSTFWKDFGSILPHFGLAIIAFLFFIIPGSIFLSALRINRFFPPAERIAVVIAASMTLPVCIMEWTSIIHYHWTQGTVRIVYAGLAILYVFGIVKTTQNLIRKFRSSQSPSFEMKFRILQWLSRYRYLFALLLIFIFALTVRLIMIRDLAAPPWVDSVHHALLTRIIMEKGMFPDTYSPYITADNARYHPGYHVTLAVFQWLSGLELQTGMLFYGQLLNAIIIFGVFLLTKSFTNNNKIGLLAALIAGIFTPMPAYYTSWGRYTQLAGLVIMPAAFAVIKFILSSEFANIDSKSPRIALYFMAGILCAGLFIIHYRVIVFLALLLIAFVIVKNLGGLKNRSWLKTLFTDLSLIFVIVAISVLLSLPWLPGALAEFIVPRIESSLKGDTGFAGHSWAYLTTASGTWTLYLAIAGIALGIFKKRKFTWVLILWVAFLFVMSNLNMLNLPMSGFINNTSVEIALFIPIAVLGSYSLVFVIDGVGRRFQGKWSLIYYGIIGLLIVCLSLFGAQKLLPILNSDTVLAHQADIPAIHWIENNIPADETISINPLAWGYGLYTGADGGFWITPLSGRKTMPPPLLYGFDTRGEISRHVTEMSKATLEKSSDPIALYDLLISENIHYVYLGAKGGVFSHQKLINSNLYKLVYNEDGVWIFLLIR